MEAAAETLYPSADVLIANGVASRIHAKDASLYDFSEEARACAEDFMGWSDLASNPPVPLKKIQKLAKRFQLEGMKSVILIGQGGSTQAAMAMTKYLKGENPSLRFFILDSDSPVRLESILAKCNPKKTLVVVSSKSGGTLEMRSMLAALRDGFLATMNAEEFFQHLVAITDPGSPLANRAISEGWAAILYGEPSVGGRFSALSVFGLFPAAMAGVSLKRFMKAAAKEEALCSQDSLDNPAIALAAFLFDNCRSGRDKIALLTQKRGRALGLWIEQLLAESTGKQGQGILPYLEVDTLLLAHNRVDRTVVVFETDQQPADNRLDFQKSLSYINKGIPRQDFTIESIEAMARQFVRWEYATAMVGFLLCICPFDQPDVASAKSRVLEILDDGLAEPDFTEEFLGDISMGMAKVHLSACCRQDRSIYGALKSLLGSIGEGDYFALNAFLPFVGEGRKRALESIRLAVGEQCGVASCLEIGPRFLHSTGQLQKGGPNQGVFLVISAEETEDVVLMHQPAKSLGQLAEAQATGDALTLAERGRRCLHIHLPDNHSVTLRYLAALVQEVLEDIQEERSARR